MTKIKSLYLLALGSVFTFVGAAYGIKYICEKGNVLIKICKELR